MADDDDDKVVFLDPFDPSTKIEMAKSMIRSCPHFIMVPEHYNDNGTCKCWNPDHLEMVEWGYVWDIPKAQWVAPADPDEA